MKLKVLIVDDDRACASLVKRVLQDNDFAADHVLDADRALAYLKSYLPDALVLDLNLPGLSGLQLCGILRKEARTANLPILMLTSMSSDRDRVKGLDTGADDYLVKPFSPKELIARIRAVLRRVKREEGAGRTLSGNGVELDLDRHEVRVRGIKTELRPKEYDLLVKLMERPGYVLSFQNLAEAVWGFDAIVSRHTISEHIKNLREKLGDCAAGIETVPDAGYRFLDAA